MNVLLVYFSGTGNTKRLTALYAAALESCGNTVTTVGLPDKLPDASAFDCIGIGYPIHAFNAPRIIIDMCKRLPKLDKKHGARKRVFIYKTSGEPVRMSDISSLKIKSILKRRGYDVTNEYQYIMPYNIIFRHGDNAVYKMWTTAQDLVPADVAEILDGTPRLPKKMFMGGFLAWILRCEHWGAHINGRLYKANKNCIKCGKCEKLCPVENIHITKKGKIKFGGKCIMCMRCVQACPKAAIDLGLFNGWKVNGEYSFEAPNSPDPPSKHDGYCEKAYKRYYADAEARIAAHIEARKYIENQTEY